MKKILTILAVAILPTLGFSSDISDLLKKANKEYEFERYHNAIPVYEEIIQLKNDHAEAIFKAGVCHLLTLNMEKGLEYIEKAYTIDPEVDEYYKYWYGRALHENYKFDEAIAEYQFYLEKFSRTKDSRHVEIEILISQAQLAKELYSKPEYYKITNLGEGINSEYHDHSPLVAHGGKEIIFTSQREYENHHEQDVDGHFYEAIFVTELDDNGNWGKPYSLSATLESPGHDACIQLFDHEQRMLIHKQTHHGDFYESVFKDGKWSAPEKVDGINTHYYEVDASITSDGKRIYFSTDNYTKGSDLNLYYADKGDDGEWGTAKAIKELNTEADENSPFITEDGKTMYFSSNGKSSMGGYDIFKTTLNDDGTWSAPVNMGYPINTMDHDVYYHEYEDMVLFASHRKGGFGELDLYQSQKIHKCVINGELIAEKTNMPITDEEVKISLVSVDGSDFNYTAAASNKEGRFDTEILSATTYNAIFTKGVDTIHVEEVKVDLMKKEEGSINKRFVLKYVDPVVVADLPNVDTATIASLEPGEGAILRSIYFDYKSSDLRDLSRSELDNIKLVLDKYPNMVIQLGGHTDNVGSQGYNLKLSRQRANSAVEYLKSKGVSKSRLKAKGYGKLKPVAKNDSEDGRQKNRRTEITVLSK